MTGIGEQLLRAGQATLALTGIDTYFKEDVALDWPRVLIFGGFGCAAVLIGLYLKARGDRS